MKNGMKLLFGLALVGLTYTACSDDDDDDDVQPTTTNNTGGGGNNNPTNPTGYTSLGTDPTGDANGSLDVIETEYFYDDSLDVLMFRVSTANLASHSSNPSVDFNFELPNGTSNNDALGRPFSGTIMTHRSIHVYTDNGGTPPMNYTYNDTTDFAVNGVNLTIDTQNASSGGDLDGICSGCVDLEVDVPNNVMIVKVDRKRIISDSEVGSSKAAKLKMSSGVGAARRGTDTGTDGVEFTIYIK
jgi:hypothetical protein